MANTYDAGDKVRISVTFTDVNGALIDPFDVSLHYGLPNAAPTVQDYNPGNIIRDSIGAYHYDLDTTGMSGVLAYYWIAPPNQVGQGVDRKSLYISPLPF